MTLGCGPARTFKITSYMLPLMIGVAGAVLAGIADARVALVKLLALNAVLGFPGLKSPAACLVLMASISVRIFVTTVIARYTCGRCGQDKGK